MSLFRLTAAVVLAFGATFATPSLAQKKYDTGATDTEIKIGQTIPLSGPASAYGAIGRVQAAYIRMINEQGGINGRKINFISYDDAYSPPKTVEQTRRLVESDEILFMAGPFGTASNSAIHKYMNGKKVPSFSWPARRKNGQIRSIFPGPWVGCRAPRAKRASMGNTS